MDEGALRGYYAKRGFGSEEAETAVSAVRKFEEYLTICGKGPDGTLADVKGYVALLVEKNENSAQALLALARYFYITRRNDIYIYFTSVFGGEGVMENIKARIAELEGEQTAERIFRDIKHPPLGAPSEDMAEMTKRFMKELKIALPPDRCKKVLAGNNHGITEESEAEEKIYFQRADSLEQYLADRHERSVNVLKDHCGSGKIWYEQIITQEVVDFVEADQEILSAVKKGDKLYITKIPYDAVNYLTENDPVMKRYHACHCPFARSSILTGKSVDPDWCCCSAGYEKYPFELIFGVPLEIELIGSVLNGDERCRFAITIPKEEAI
jgi:hypothetical protein